MRIIDDKISFDPADFRDLSDSAKRALTGFFGDRVLFSDILADVLNEEIVKAKASAASATAAQVKLTELSDLLAKADAAAFAQAAAQIDQIRVSLGGVPAAPDESAAPLEAPSVMGRILSFFKG